MVKVRGPGVGRSLSDTKVIGLNLCDAEIGLDFDDPQKMSANTGSVVQEVA